MKKGKYNLSLLSLLALMFSAIGVNAQFDDLYYDETEYESVASFEDLAYADYDEDVFDDAEDYMYDGDEY